MTLLVLSLLCTPSQMNKKISDLKSIESTEIKNMEEQGETQLPSSDQQQYQQQPPTSESVDQSDQQFTIPFNPPGGGLEEENVPAGGENGVAAPPGEQMVEGIPGIPSTSQVGIDNPQ